MKVNLRYTACNINSTTSYCIDHKVKCRMSCTCCGVSMAASDMEGSDITYEKAEAKCLDRLICRACTNNANNTCASGNGQAWRSGTCNSNEHSMPCWRSGKSYMDNKGAIGHRCPS